MKLISLETFSREDIFFFLLLLLVASLFSSFIIIIIVFHRVSVYMCIRHFIVDKWIASSLATCQDKCLGYVVNSSQFQFYVSLSSFLFFYSSVSLLCVEFLVIHLPHWNFLSSVFIARERLRERKKSHQVREGEKLNLHLIQVASFILSVFFFFSFPCSSSRILILSSTPT